MQNYPKNAHFLASLCKNCKIICKDAKNATHPRSESVTGLKILLGTF